MIELAQLTKKFGSKMVVDQASACFKTGQVTAIIGPNGAGKSTLLSMASRLLVKDSGQVFIDSRELAQWDTRALAKRLAVLRQANNLSMRFSVRELVSFGRFPHSGGKLSREDKAVIDKAIDYLDLTGIQHRYLDELSGGQRQLAFIAMVVAQDTEYVFLDEPLNNLDIKHSLQIMRNIRVLAHELNKAVVIVIHDINFASCYSDHIIVLKQGRVITQGPVNEVIRAEVLSDIYDTDFDIADIRGQRICLYYG
ncbi:ABC transporter ATP-binding protein [Oceanisphaera psychrotolerans]|uniref:Iron ABC transporter ATP-binding protein n=1 Tax=Oceanisphaera psychrotolerans TaxID=1414654 RepID=A0A1J4QDU9_9GAMM|nr:ATP-binding cassette domain-containing protein [Oceanisphaera psychrotolerans]OIN10445.1 iron ABC transporter ATP-binding protein [Oceanisphaera psychrotolerans]